ncbi:iron chaperone [Streptomyces sp. NPDC006530]|uniref:iron chaperone n=1 Tax=Streptomyces sp. NPDC006530 TaxID=3364750 RepID=UPI0036A2B442
MPSATSSPENAENAEHAEKYEGFSAEERAAMKEHAREQKKTAARRGASRAEKAAAAEQDVLAKIAEMPEADRVLAERIHDIVKSAAPDLEPKLWYGMPAYARDGKVVCHFQSAEKFKSRYATLGFSDLAALDEGAMWATSYALKELTAADEQFISALVKKAVN